MEWIIANPGSVVVLMVLAVFAFFVVRKELRDMKRGGGCSGCPSKGACSHSCTSCDINFDDIDFSDCPNKEQQER